MSDTPPPVEIKPAGRSLLDRVSLIWIIPIAALVIALGVAYQSYTERGPIIEIAFDNAAGITPEQTELRYRDVAVGLVEEIGFSDDLERVVAYVRVVKDAVPYIDSGANFWVVRPKVTARGVTGLDTVLSGVFIEGQWDTTPGEFVNKFAGLGDAPLIHARRNGLQIALRSSGNVALNADTPIFYRSVEVGRMGPVRISRNGSYSVAEAIIDEPYDRLISKTTRFWDSSGFTFTLGPGGAELDFTSLASLIGGGVTFGTIVSGGEAVQDGAVFEVYNDEDAARASVFNALDVETLELTAVFDDKVAGLTIGAPVELSGLPIGKVSNLSGIVDRAQFGDSQVRLYVTMSIQPARLGLSGETTSEDALSFISERVRGGLRARLASASILTGGLKVELVDVEEAQAASVDLDGDPFPVIPTTQSEISDVAATAEGVFNRINNLPVEQLLESAIGFLDNARALVADQSLRETPDELKGLISDLRGLVGSDEAQKVPVLLNTALTRVEGLLGELDEQRAVARIVTAVDLAAEAANKLGNASSTAPALIKELTAVAANARDLPLDDLVRQVTALAASASAIIGSDGAKAVPASLNTALGEITAVVSDLREERAVERLVAAVDAASLAATRVGDATDGVPALIEQLYAVAATAAGLPLADLITQATDLLTTAGELVSTEGAKAVPDNLNAALGEVAQTLVDLRRERAIERIGAAADAATLAAGDVSASVEDVPGLIDSLNAVAARAETIPLDELSAQLTRLLESAQGVIGTQDAQDLPGTLNDALGEVQAALAELRAGGAIENTNKTLESVRDASNQIAISVRDLPVLINRMTTLLNQASRTLQDYDGRSELNRGARDALRDVAKAADAVSSLARTIERNPNSLLLGR